MAATTSSNNALHSRIARQSPEWLTRGVMYQVWLRSFTPEGTLRAATEKLAHVAGTGATIIYLSPVCLQDDDIRQEFWSERQKKCGFNNPKNPYRIKDYNAVDPEYGTDDDLRAFVNEAHRLGMRVLLDLVYFHCGPTSVLMEHPGYFKKNPDGTIATGEWHFPVLNYESPELREYMWKNMERWITDFDMDGFRCDVSDAVPLDFWEEARARLTPLRPDLVILAEGERAADQLSAFDIDYGFSWYYVTRDVFAGKKNASEMRTLWQRVASERPRGNRVLRFTENHDFANDTGTNRVETMWGSAGAEAMLAVNFTLDGVPFIYNGQEIADASPQSIYTRLPVHWELMTQAKAKSRLAFCRDLCRLRGTERALSQGDVVWIDNNQPDSVLSFIRAIGNEQIAVIVNLSKLPVKTSIAVENISAFEPLMTRGTTCTMTAQDKGDFILGAYGFYIGTCKK
ncbi:MAG: hypothetical protein HZC28_17870 [Spirochaetes bacterium]|nr:hypothetical protein [Spirochaetota bacterium]